MAMNHSIKFVYFDIGDTLVAEVNAATIMNAIGLKEKIFREAYIKHNKDMSKGKLNPSDFIEGLKNNLHISQEEAFEKWNTASKNLAIIEPMHQLAKDLKAKYKIGLLSNIYKGHFEIFYGSGKIPQIEYNAVIKSCDEGIAKPEKEIFNLAQKLAGVPAKEIFFIDNKKEHIAVARELGWQGYLFDPKNVTKSVKELRNILL